MMNSFLVMIRREWLGEQGSDEEKAILVENTFDRQKVSYVLRWQMSELDTGLQGHVCVLKIQSPCSVRLTTSDQLCLSRE